ncbi:MAG: hypothetical protein QM804_10600 [Propionicimonas sp.]
MLRIQGIGMREQLLVALPWHAYASPSFDGRNVKPSTRDETGPPLG